jgi:putative ABC transport system ATP-binding protein
VLAQLVAGLVRPSSGSLKIGGHEVVDLPIAVLGRRIAYVGGESSLMSGTVGDNLYYVLKHRPVTPAAYTASEAGQRRRVLAEAAIAGNSVQDIQADWIDHDMLGVSDSAGLRKAALGALKTADMVDDVYQLGLRVTIDTKAQPDLVQRLLSARLAVRQRLAQPENAPLVEPFDPAKFIVNATLAENLFFGTADAEAFDPENLGGNEYVREVLRKAKLTGDFFKIGMAVASDLLELAGDLPAGNSLLAEFSVIRIEDLPQYRPVVDKAKRDGAKGLSAAEQAMILSVPFKIVPMRDRHVQIGPNFKEKLLLARRSFSADLPDALKDKVEFFDPGRFNSALTLRDNILFGKVAINQAQAAQRANGLISAVVAELELRDTIVEAGLAFHVGTRGARLAVAQRQKLAIARALLKNADLVVLAEATSALDAASDARVAEALLNRHKGRGVLWALQNPNAAKRFDRVLMMAEGRVVEEGSFQELVDNDGVFAELLKN